MPGREGIECDGDNGADRAAVEVKGQVGESFGKMRTQSREAVRFERESDAEGGSETATVRDFRIEPDLACVQVLHDAPLP